MRESERLPTHRELSRALGISVQTVSNAYRELEAGGWIASQVGRGTFVAPSYLESPRQFILDRRESRIVDLSTVRIAHDAHHDGAFRDVCAVLARSPNQPWTRACRPIAGSDDHRETAAEWLGGLGIEASDSDILICNGATHSITVALLGALPHGAAIAADACTDHGIIGASRLLGFNLLALESDGQGILPDYFEESCAKRGVRALFVVPNLNNPTVSLMGAGRRQEIAKIASKYDVYIIEDDVYAPLLSKRSQPFRALVPELTFYCTSMTKSVMTALRVGFLVPPSALFLRAESALRLSSWSVSTVLSEIAARLVASGEAGRLVARQRRLVEQRQEQVSRLLGKYLIRNHPRALFAWIRVPEQWQVGEAVKELRRVGVAVTSPEPFMVPGGDSVNAFRICVCGNFDAEQFSTALRRIDQILSSCPAMHLD